MLDLVGIATALRDIARDLQDDESNFLLAGGTDPANRQAFLGINESFPSTPACEVILADGRLQSLPAGAEANLHSVRLQVVFYVAMSKNLDGAELELVPIAEAFMKALHADDFDFTLDGRVEDCRPSNFDFDLVNRNGRFYRYAAVEVHAGDLGSEI